jgi:hypothetical protein
MRRQPWVLTFFAGAYDGWECANGQQAVGAIALARTQKRDTEVGEIGVDPIVLEPDSESISVKKSQPPRGAGLGA